MVLCAVGAGCGSDVSPTPVCTYSVSATSLSVSAAGGSSSVTVTTQSECSWTARSDVSWITIASGASGTGTGSVGVTVAPNTTVSVRTSPLIIAEHTVTVSQAAATVTCEYAVTPDRTSFSKDGGTGTATVDAAGPCTWTAASDAPWLTITSGAQGTGGGVVSYLVARNFDIADRRAGLVIAARTFDIVQSGDTGGCQYSVVPVELSVCMSVPNELTTTITTQGSCPWTATTGAPWLTVVGGQSGTGSGSVRFRVSENWDAPRDAPIQVRWPTPTAGQNVRVFQAGCLYSVTRSAITMPVSGGSANFDVLQQSVPNTCGGATQNACVWTAQADVPWITIVTSMPQAGDNRVSFTAAGNATGVARTGNIRVRDKTVVVTQPGQ
jgi:Putative binding domain, N-terminal/Viral BACON domain